MNTDDMTFHRERPPFRMPDWDLRRDAEDNHDRRADALTEHAVELLARDTTEDTARAQVFATLAAAERTATQAALLGERLDLLVQVSR